MVCTDDVFQLHFSLTISQIYISRALHFPNNFKKKLMQNVLETWQVDFLLQHSAIRGFPKERCVTEYEYIYVIKLDLYMRIAEQQFLHIPLFKLFFPSIRDCISIFDAIRIRYNGALDRLITIEVVDARLEERTANRLCHMMWIMVNHLGWHLSGNRCITGLLSIAHHRVLVCWGSTLSAP